MRQIFISYDPADEDFALQLTDDLLANGANVWIDIRNAEPGRHWSRSIEHALSESTMMVVILSPEALASRQVAAEWQAYLEAYRPVLPVVAEPCDPPGPLRTRRPIDFTRERLYHRGFQDLMTRLIDMNTRVRRQAPVVWSDPDAEDSAASDEIHTEPPTESGGMVTVDSETSTLRRAVESLRDRLLR